MRMMGTRAYSCERRYSSLANMAKQDKDNTPTVFGMVIYRDGVAGKVIPYSDVWKLRRDVAAYNAKFAPTQTAYGIVTTEDNSILF